MLHNSMGRSYKDEVMSEIESLSKQALADIAAASTPDALEALRVSLLGKHGSITGQLKSLGALPAEQRKAAGEAINRARDAIGAALSARKSELEDAALDARLAGETIDVTLPGRDAARGGLHPISRTIRRAPCTTRSTCLLTAAGMAACCAPIPRACRCATWTTW